MTCILCGDTSIQRFYRNEYYTYLHCQNCDLVFATPDERLTSAEEKQRYDQHENDPDDKEYRNFLDQLFTPLYNRLSPGSYGLDYGSGPGPTLSVMFEEAGHPMEIFDPFYANNRSVFDMRFDFITSTETVEHFYYPAREFERLWSILKPGGYLGIMTLLRPQDLPFSEWHYIRDDTHVSLYSKDTFSWLADHLNAGLQFYGDRVIILRKSEN